MKKAEAEAGQAKEEAAEAKKEAEEAKEANVRTPVNNFE